MIRFGIGMRVLACAAALLGVLPAAAQTFPAKTVRLVNPFPPGGPLDILGRTLDALPGVQSTGAQGVAGFDLKSQPFWYGLLAPAGTPPEVVARINADTVKALKDEKVSAALRAARMFVIGNSPDQFAAMIRDGHEAWGRVIRETGVRGE